MTKYILTSEMFTGHLVFGYAVDGKLSYFSNEATLADNHYDWLARNFPLQLSALPVLKGNKGTATITEVPPDLSFDAFWNGLPKGKKINRKRCLTLWDKMNEATQMLAIAKWSEYEKFCHKNSRILADPETYLIKEYYLNEWR
jgi:hypothetical protein